MNKILFIIFNLIYITVLDHLLFGFTAYFQGKKVNFDCNKCKNWACTHGTEYEKKGCYPVRDWGKWCKK